MGTPWVGASLDRLNPGRQTLIGATQIYAEAQTAYQHLIIAEVPASGRGLFLDGNVQLLERGEQTYHERIGLLPVLLHEQPERVLILGGGDGCAAREVLRDPRVAEVTIAELDAEVVRLCDQHLAVLNQGSLHDPRVQLVFGDGRVFLQQAKLSDYAVIIIDFLDAYSTDELHLYHEVLSRLAEQVTKQTIISLHGDVAAPPYWPGLHLLALSQQHFPHVGMHRAFVECYTSEWGFILAGKQAPFSQLLTAERITAHAARLATPLQTIVPALFPTQLEPSPEQASLYAQIARDPFAFPDDQHTPETQWLSQADLSGKAQNRLF